nr:hypothetical protein [Pseudomonas sp. Leaf58]
MTAIPTATKAVELNQRGTQLTLEINTHVVGQQRPSVIMTW